MPIKKQAVLDGVALDAYNKLKESLPFISDSHLLRAGLIVISRLDADELRQICVEASLRVGKPPRQTYSTNQTGQGRAGRGAVGQGEAGHGGPRQGDSAGW